jgi:class 3 adenylate cyclase/tetratricopeptide (TPR) repeat protein
MQCPGCRHENPPQAKFCLECGARFAVACAQCGTQLPVGAKFCLECGTPTDSHGTEPARFASPQSYTPKHLAEKILTSKAALEGERKQVTVLFADLKGSMELLADRDPEEARKLLDPVLERMMEAVHRYEGTVNQVMGDGIMALFGAPLAHEDHAVRACYAALRMQESVKRYAEGVRREQGVTLRIRVGLNSGEVVVRAIGSDLHMDYTAVGQTTHLAARMEQLADPGSILLSPATLELAEGYVAVKPLGPVPVKGLPEPVEVYELVGAGAVRSRLHAAAARGLTRFVGRDNEVDQLLQALEQAQAGHGQVVAVVGEPGVGKSRLYWEFTHSHRAHGGLILESGSVSYGKATAYLPIIDLLKAYFQIEGQDATRTIRERVTGKVLSLDRALEPSLSALLSLLEVPVDDEAWGRLDPEQRRQRTMDAVKRLLLRESQVQPLILLFEDLHWIDAETQALLDSLVESLPTARLLLLASYRPEYQHRWGSKTYYRQLRIDPLQAESAADLLTSLLGTDKSLESLKCTLIERTEGNPLFLEESVRALVETKTLIGERGAYRLAQDATAIQVPATVQAILAARIDRLSPEDKRLLHTAAVIGKDVPYALLLSIAELADEDLRRGLVHLQGAEFLYETSLFPDLAYTFKHALTHEVTYASLLQERRRLLHARVVDTLETLHSDRLGEQIERLAHHATRGEVWAKALSYAYSCGEKTASRSANREATVHFDQALAALRHLPESRDRSEQAIDLLLNLREAHFALGDFDKALGCLDEAEALAQPLEDQRRLGHISCFRGLQFWVLGDHQSALAMGQRALMLAKASNDIALQAPARDILGRTYHSLGAYPQGIDVLSENVASLGGDLLRKRFGMAGFVSVLSRHFLALCYGEIGAFAQGNACAEEAVRIAEAAQHPHSLVSAYVCVGRLAIYRGELSKAVEVLKRALAICQDANIRVWIPVTSAVLAYAYARSTPRIEISELLEQASVYRGPWLIPVAETYLLAGRIHEAHALAKLLLDLLETRGEQGHYAWVLCLIGDIAACRQPMDVTEAETRYSQALAIADGLGMRPRVAHCHAALAKLYQRTGKPELAHEHLATATTMYREMDMQFWLEQAEAELKEPGA